MIDYDKLLNKLHKFPDNDKSTFYYWVSHWLAYNLVAMKLGVWQPMWLLHDIEKPWLKLLWGDYIKVRQWHKYHNKHHVFSGRHYGLNKINWLAAVLDWECSRYTKLSGWRTAKEQVDLMISQTEKYTHDEIEETKKNCYPILKYLKLWN